MASTDLTQPINRKEAQDCLDGMSRIHSELGPLITRLQANDHDDAPDYLDDAVSLINNAMESVIAELDSARSKAA